MNKKKLIPIVILLLVVIGVLVRIFLFPSQFRYVGTVEATDVDIPARVSSVISELKVDEGYRVEPGQELLVLSCEDYKVASDLANVNFERTNRLFKVGSAPKENLDVARNQKQESDLKVQWCSVRSPITGTVLTKYHEAGEWVSPGTRLFTIADLREVWAYIYVAENVLRDLKLGMKVQAFIPDPVEGTIVKISDQAEFTPKNAQTIEERTRLVYGIKVSFKNEKELLKPGMSIEVRLQ